MTESQFAQFLAKVKDDSALQKSLASDTGLFAAGAKAGFTFTHEDIDAVKASIDENQLAGVLGGGTGTTLGWAGFNVGAMGIPIIVDTFSGVNTTK